LLDSLIIIPTYNEIENIESIIHIVLEQDDSFAILVVDDGSPDNTAEKVKELQASLGDRLNLIQRSGKLGLGTAYIAGFKYGLENGFDYIFEMDADFSHPPTALIEMKNILLRDEADMAIGSRYTKGGKIQNWPKDRLILSYGASLYVRLLTRMSVKDPTAGFVCYKSKVLKAMDLDSIKAIGYAFQIELKYYATRLGFRLKEYPITFKDREKGTSKMDSSIITEAIFGVIKMILRKY